MQVLEVVIFSCMSAIMETFFYLSLMQGMLRHWIKERGSKEKGMQENVVSLATGTVLLRAQVASVLKTVKQNVCRKI